ncbi:MULTISPECIES: translational GTPase TypA [Thalassospira]|uniref:Large ribosomal subunit assembly factor BipA n=2 Tax=Thalassospira tepidiphila TaxID=393657 RepID=A0A853L2W2_9PROT|nr:MULTISPECIES: translational GTPase TypA [Thalassospira]KZD02634.1 GTP-binding protein TypA [Thalassospira sp. MCCC 1A02898]MBE71355.1 translational GTPase TypA [Thalassospira sp.]MBO6578050.1 translational GTPase TypA [Thalassospira sp.]MBO6817802.1 translational GTPase TypA [Thalassospira sp.]MBO6886873.1 translational GTPase TypA [Thalassospira sp.]
MSLRNIAIIAHVDHGKTTLVDSMFRQSGVYRDNQRVDERAMDSNDLERERGITIVAKPTAVQWGETRVNIVDTPGHADFGGEVERILSMVEGVVLLVDSAEGPMPQTKFVLGKALKLGLKPIVIINKIDRPDQRAEEVLDEIFDLFVSLEASEEQLDFPVLYASGRDGWAAENPEGPKENLTPLMELVLSHVPAPDVDEKAPFAMLATMLHADNFLGRILTGRVYQGRAKLNMPVKVIRGDGTVETGRLSKLMGFRGLERVPQEEAVAGDIIAIAGLTEATVADTICSTEVTTAIESQPIDPPTLAMTFSVNNSPLAGQEGDKVTSRMIRARLEREAEGNIAIKIGETEDKDAFEVAGRGELQLGVLVETMRREGFELSISRPRVLFKEIDGVLSEPFEEVQVDVDEEYSGVVVEKMSLRKAEMTDMRSSGGGKTRIIFIAPSRGLIGYHGEFLTDTRGTGVMNRVFHSYGPVKGSIAGRRNGALISNDQGEAVAYALFNLEDRGIMFIEHGERVYQGMIIGEHNRDNDLEVNVLKGKKLTNVRASGKDEAVTLTPPRRMSLEEALSYIQDDELVEVTPKSVRIRKLHLDPNVRKRESRKKEG